MALKYHVVTAPFPGPYFLCLTCAAKNALPKQRLRAAEVGGEKGGGHKLEVLDAVVTVIRDVHGAIKYQRQVFGCLTLP